MVSKALILKSTTRRSVRYATETVYSSTTYQPLCVVRSMRLHAFARCGVPETVCDYHCDCDRAQSGECNFGIVFKRLLAFTKLSRNPEIIDSYVKATNPAIKNCQPHQKLIQTSKHICIGVWPAPSPCGYKEAKHMQPRHACECHATFPASNVFIADSTRFSSAGGRSAKGSCNGCISKLKKNET